MYGPEFEVYSGTVEYLQSEGWKIVCASPPGGTDNRFRKCLLPRRTVREADKGLRDEVDITAYRGGQIILVECKPTLSDSLTKLNALNESDLDKLRRISSSFPLNVLPEMLMRATGLVLPRTAHTHIVLAVGTVDHALPAEVAVLEVGSRKQSLVKVYGAVNLFGPD